MVRLGMDVDVVESVGKQLRQQGQQVASLVRAVDALIDTADGQWWGARGRDFVHQWRTLHRRRLLEVAASVDELSSTALRNVEEQRRTSGSSSAGESSRGLHHAAASNSPPRDDRAQGYRNLEALNGFLGHGVTQVSALAAFLGGVATTYRGRPYGAAYKKLFGGSEFMHYNRTLQHLYSPTARKVLENPLMDKVDLVGKGFTLVDKGVGLYKNFFDPNRASSASFGDKIWAGGSAAGSALKMSKNPVAYLAGAAVTSWSLVGSEAAKVDYSPEATQQTWDYIRANPGAVGEEFGKAAKRMFTKDIWEIFG
jgi:hypothetical protein